MEQNKTGKYLKYAIGEIILVMIGILLALQVNNWNQNRINRGIEKGTLSSLKIDLDTAFYTLEFENMLSNYMILGSIQHTRLFRYQTKNE